MSKTHTLYQAFADSLAIPLSQVNDDLTYNTIAQWDSTAHMVLVAELESQFDIMLDTDDIIDLSSVGKAKTILTKYDVTFES